MRAFRTMQMRAALEGRSLESEIPVVLRCASRELVLAVNPPVSDLGLLTFS
jgi:hypothetical protein